MTAIVCRIVGLCVFRFSRDRPEYLLLRRAADEQLYPGIWQFVTGAIDGEEPAWRAALRELTEETGLHPERFWAVPHVSTFYDVNADAVNLSPLFAAQVLPGRDPVLSTEHQTFAWLSYKETTARLVWPDQKRGLEVVHRELVGGTEAGRLSQIPL